MRSAPSLYSTGEEVATGQKSVVDTSDLTHPLSIELKRWQKFAAFSETESKSGPDLHKPPQREPPKKSEYRSQLVNFPKYMLIHNCHLKSTDQQRYVKEENAKRAAGEEAMRQAAESGQDLFMDSGRSMVSQSTVKMKDASWGAPRLRTAEDKLSTLAGSALPAGRGQRTSNPFRMG